MSETTVDYTVRASVDLFSRDSMTLYEVHTGKCSFKVMDYSLSLTVPFVLRELMADNYDLLNRPFADGAEIIDIGANVGVVSIFLARQFPLCTFYAYEPLSLNYANLCRNLHLNDITNVVPVNAAVTANGRAIKLHFNYDNLGGASGFMGQPPYLETSVKSVTLDDIFDTHKINRCALLKMDCEGAEHEILACAQDLLGRIDYLAMEAHFTPTLRQQGYSEATLQQSIQPLIDRRAARVTVLEAAA